MAISLVIGLYGALNDYESVTLVGALLMVIGLMLPVWININKEQKYSKMKKVIAVVISISFVVGCSNNNSKTASREKKDSSTLKDTNANTEYNPAAPPVSNSQY